MTPTRYAEACERAADVFQSVALWGDALSRADAAATAATLSALAQALREAKAWAEWLPKPDNAPKVYALTLPTETGA